MTSVLWNARSELVIPAKPCGAGVCDTMRMFQIASPASASPALRPMRGSGEGGVTSGADMLGIDEPAIVTEGEDDEPPEAQPIASDAMIGAASIVRGERAMNERVMESSTRECDGRTNGNGVSGVRDSVRSTREGLPTSAACA